MIAVDCGCRNLYIFCGKSKFGTCDLSIFQGSYFESFMQIQPI